MFNYDTIIYYVLSALAVLISLTVHEFSHAYAAHKLGDPTARNLGRLTLNPIKHIDIVGAICMVLFHFGWAKPVPVNIRNFRKPKRDFAITAMAGPISNIIMALLTSLLYVTILRFMPQQLPDNGFLLNLIQNTLTFVYLFHVISVGHAIFNLIPIPPLDGSRLLAVIFPPKIYYAILNKERQIYIGLLVWLLLGGRVVAMLRAIPLVASTPLLYNGVMIFSLTEMIGHVINFISELMLNLWAGIMF